MDMVSTMEAANAEPTVPALIPTEPRASTRTRSGVGWFSHSLATTASAARTPNPAPVTSVLPAAAASSCRTRRREGYEVGCHIDVVTTHLHARVGDRSGGRGEAAGGIDDHGGTLPGDLGGDVIR
ncbi:hypothetical protein ACIREE_37510 [Streptomyces sp. NPDC102467]|uniref:hypothetical protein n=1 Tax=Streptomyces sp. NPDC102467 TaxID=3366179 RepID=UPI00381E965D